MSRRTYAGLSAAPIVIGGLLVPSAPAPVATETDWAPLRTAEGHPEAIVTLDNGDTIAVGDGGWVTRRTAGESDWSAARHEIAEHRRAATSAAAVASSHNTVIVSYRDSGMSTYAWSPGNGWSEPVDAEGPVWTGIKGVVGVGDQQYVPGRGWTSLPEIPIEPLAMGADRAGRVTAVGRQGEDLRIARFTPGEGWAPAIRLTGLDPDASIDLAVAPDGHRAITVPHDHRLVLLRRLGDQDWQRFVVTEARAPQHQVHLDEDGRASVVWEQAGPLGQTLLLASRLSVDGEWETVQQITQLLLPDDHGLAIDGTSAGELALAYRRAEGNGWTTYVRQRISDGGWSEETEVASTGDQYGVTMSPDACTTGFAWTERLARFTARTLGDCAGAEPEPVETRTPWDSLTTPVGARTYESDVIHVVRTTDGHTFLGWTNLRERQALASEVDGSDYGEPVPLSPDGKTCTLHRLDAFESTVQAILDCGYRDWHTLTWSADAGWLPPARLPSPDGAADFDVNRAGATAAVFAIYDRAKPYGMLYRPAPDAAWERLPAPPAFDGGRIRWRVHLTGAGDIVLVNDIGSEYAIYRQADGAWSALEHAPLTAPHADRLWRVADDGTLLAWQYGRGADRFTVRAIDGEWSDPHVLAGGGRCRDAHLTNTGQVAVVEADDRCGSGRDVTLRARDFDIASGTWSEPTALGEGASWVEEPRLRVGPGGDLLVVWSHDDRLGYTRPDSLWRRPVGSTWSEEEYVLDGYGLGAVILTDGTMVVTSDTRADAAGVWLALR